RLSSWNQHRPWPLPSAFLCERLASTEPFRNRVELYLCLRTRDPGLEPANHNEWSERALVQRQLALQQRIERATLFQWDPDFRKIFEGDPSKTRRHNASDSKPPSIYKDLRAQHGCIFSVVT